MVFDQNEAGSAAFGWPGEENDRWSQLADRGVLIEMFIVLEQPHSHCFIDHVVAKARHKHIEGWGLRAWCNHTSLGRLCCSYYIDSVLDGFCPRSLVHYIY